MAILKFRTLAFLIFAAECLPVAIAQQTTTSQLDGLTPPSLAPGTPAGSYALSGFETVNLYSGSLDFHLPLLKVGGARGQSAYNMVLPVQQLWHIEQNTSCSGGGCTAGNYYASPSSWNPTPDPYGPGRLDYRYDQTPYPPSSVCTDTLGNVTLPIQALQSLTRLTFTAPDGTEYELRDDSVNGEPKPLTGGDQCFGTTHATPFPRGSLFSAHDGSEIRFVSDYSVTDTWAAGVTTNSQNPPTGNLLFPDGSLYGIVCGQVSYVRDRNGNQTTFHYENTWSYSNGSCTLSGNLQGRVTQIVDSLGRQVVINYGESPEGLGNDLIWFTGYQGAWREIVVQWTYLSSALRGDFSGVQTYPQLFQEFPDMAPNPFNPVVVSGVQLPNGSSYTLRYNPYGELARVVLPTGGAYEYDYGSGYTNSSSNDGVSGGETSSATGIYRRILTRRVYSNGSTAPVLVLTQAFSAGTTAPSSGCEPISACSAPPAELLNSYLYTTAVSVSNSGSGITAWTDVHHYQGDPGVVVNFVDSPQRSYVPWQEGREIQTDSGGLRSEFQTWGQSGQTSWWVSQCHLTVWDSQYPCNSNTMPPENPHVSQLDTELLDGSSFVFSRRSMAYDQYNSLTDETDYDYSAVPQTGSIPSASPGASLKQTHNDYVWTSNANYISGSSFFFPRLVLDQTISLGGVGATSTTYEYDAYQSDSRHAALLPRSSIVQMDASYSNGSVLTRGNITGITRGLTSDATTTSYQYDVAGSVVESVDGNGHTTTYARDPNYYSSPSQPAPPAGYQNPPPNYQTPPAGNTYAFLTKITDPLSHSTGITWDLDLEKPITITEPTNVQSAAVYGGSSDPLDRLRSVVRGDVTTSYMYVDTPNAVSATTQKTLVGSSNLTTVATYDGLGRATHVATGTSDVVTIDTVYDAVGRIVQVSNPHRSTSASTDGQTSTAYDALGRVTRVTRPDLAAATNTYAGAATTASDEAGVQRVLQQDGLGRTIGVTETGLNSTTSYSYDPLDNLTLVQQSGQTRQFNYDSLSRLKAACNPESVPDGSNGIGAVSCVGALPASGVTRYIYDANNNLTNRTEPDGVSTTFNYDAGNRLTGKTYTDASQITTPAVTYCYDGQILNGGSCTGSVFTAAAGLQSASGTAQSWMNLTYDPNGMGRVTVSAQTTKDQTGASHTFNFAYGYYSGELMAGETYPSGRVVTSCYDDSGRIKWVSQSLTSSQCSAGPDSVANSSNSYASSIGYFAQGAVQSLAYGNSQIETWADNNRLQALNISVGPSGGQALWQVAYEYTRGSTANNGNVMKQTVSAPSAGMAGIVTTYGYDGANRMLTATENPSNPSVTPSCASGQGGWCQQYAIDGFGNRIVSARGANDSPGVAEPGAFNAQTNRVSGTNWKYNDRGGVVHDPTGRSYGYDAEGRMAGTCAAGEVPCPNVWGVGLQREVYTYDGAGRRVREDRKDGSWTIFAYDGSGELATESTTAGTGVTGTRYLTEDSLGSIRLTTDATGTPRDRHDYEPYGLEMGVYSGSPRSGVTGYPGSGDNDTNHLFTGKERGCGVRAGLLWG